MVPPPDNTGDEFPDFENMSFEEQMAWLESLAKRQGVGDDQLTTAADLDVPIPEGVEIDEPGYVPFEGSRSAREMQAAASAASVEPEEEEEEPVAPPAEPEMPVYEEAAPEVMGEGDPMQWLDSLAVQPADDDEVSEIMDDLFDVEAEELEQEIFAEAEEIEEAEEVEEAVAELEEFDQLDAVVDVESAQAAPAAASDDPLGGMDPMLWLESLAARQGANTSELTTSANLEIEDVDEDAVIDEPGYVPFEGSRSAREMQAASAVPLEPDDEEEPEVEFEEELPDLFAEEEEPEPELDLEDIFGEVEVEDVDEEEVLVDMFDEEDELEPELDLDDIFGEPEVEDAEAEADEIMFEGMADGTGPMEWLESLAKRQGARDEELLTSADIDVPEMPADTVVDEPGYVEYSPLSILPPEQPREDLEVVDELADVAEFDDAAGDGGLSWLEDLAAEPEEDVAEFLAFEDEVVARHAEEAETLEPEEAAVSAGVEDYDDPLAGMSDEDVARAQAQGTLTPHQELAWLKRQARALADTREAEQQALADEEIPPAEPGEIPDWLETIRQTSEQEVMTLAEDVLDEPAIERGALPDWLHEPEAEDAVPDDAFVEVSLDGDVESLWLEETAEPETSDLDQLIPDSELAAFVSGDYSASEPDALADALDEEYERIQSGDDSEPEWYTAAVDKVASETPDIVEPGVEEEAAGELVLAAAEAVDAPGWLDDIAEDEDIPEVVAAEVDDDMPDWLRSVDEAASVASGDTDMPDWLAEEVEEPVVAERDAMPDWLAEIDEEEEAPELAFEPQADASPVVKEEAAEAVPVVDVVREAPALPEDAVYEQYREKLESNSGDHVTRLALARALQSNRNADSALEQYEVLIEAAEMLPEVSGDLTAMVKTQPEQPRTQRLLGDAYMRRGMLAEALDAYRNALHQL